MQIDMGVDLIHHGGGGPAARVAGDQQVSARRVEHSTGERMPERMGSDTSQARPVAGAAQHPPSGIRCPRLAGVRAVSCTNSIPCPA